MNTILRSLTPSSCWIRSALGFARGASWRLHRSDDTAVQGESDDARSVGPDGARCRGGGGVVHCGQSTGVMTHRSSTAKSGGRVGFANFGSGSTPNPGLSRFDGVEIGVCTAPHGHPRHALLVHREARVVPRGSELGIRGASLACRAELDCATRWRFADGDRWQLEPSCRDPVGPAAAARTLRTRSP
ncbi:MAG: hypothetical protein L6Q99_15450 [Planctomycetes bacterium]|nr:hypothetical protein [Planctomycetota bacterium]